MQELLDLLLCIEVRTVIAGSCHSSVTVRITVGYCLHSV